MIRSNPLGRVPRVRAAEKGKVQLWVAGKGERTHLRHPETGGLLCMPKMGVGGKGKTKAENLVPTNASQVTCGRCLKLMTINHQLRSDDIAVGDTESLYGEAVARRRT
jgi:hypothetical protein